VLNLLEKNEKGGKKEKHNELYKKIAIYQRTVLVTVNIP
jgi:hypothetical protein